MRKLFVTTIFALLLIPLIQPETVQAQWGVGASYEVRNEEPTNGFGFRVERNILEFIPVVDLGMRAHFSFFNENNSVTREGDVTVDREIQAYDFGAAAVAGVKVALLKPYVGLGIGTENYKFDSSEGDNFSENNFYWNGFGGVELTLIPLLKPFVEYRIKGLTGAEDVEFENVGRIALGINLRF